MYKLHTHLLDVLRGAGTNACYAEQVSRIRKLPDDYQPRTEEMCINTEWGSFDADCLPLMIEDRCLRVDICRCRRWTHVRVRRRRLNVAVCVSETLDAESVNPGEAIFEKLVSGLYFG